MGQFERSLIIVDDNSSLHYIEGCTAPIYKNTSLHCSVVEIYVGKNSKCRFSSMQNWSKDVNSIVNEKAIVNEIGLMEWVSGTIGGKSTIKHPTTVLLGDNSKVSNLEVSLATEAQSHDTGPYIYHIGKNSTRKL